MDKKHALWGSAALVALAITAVIITAGQQNKNKERAKNTSQTGQQTAMLDATNPENASTTLGADESSDDVTEGENASSSSSAAALKSAKTVPAPSQAYTQAVNTYGAKGYRVQFSECHGSPGFLSLKKGVQFMLDNRDDKAHTIVLKSQKINLGAYGFGIVTARDVGTYSITCDGGGAMQLNVEG